MEVSARCGCHLSRENRVGCKKLGGEGSKTGLSLGTLESRENLQSPTGSSRWSASLEESNQHTPAKGSVTIGRPTVTRSKLTSRRAVRPRTLVAALPRAARISYFWRGARLEFETDLSDSSRRSLGSPV